MGEPIPADEVLLETDRLWLRPWRVAEAELAFELFRRIWGQGYGVNLVTTRRL